MILWKILSPDHPLCMGLPWHPLPVATSMASRFQFSITAPQLIGSPQYQKLTRNETLDDPRRPEGEMVSLTS